MAGQDMITLSRDCKAVLVPSGAPVTLQAGNEVVISQALGGSYTVLINGNMARIAGQDADALGLIPPPSATAPTAMAHGPLDEELIWDQMRTCYDPEIPVNIVDLGLVYDCRVSPLPDGGHRVEVKMTLTAPGCGMADSIKADVENRLLGVPGVLEAQVDLVWDPPWNQGMISEAAKLELGLM